MSNSITQYSERVESKFLEAFNEVSAILYEDLHETRVSEGDVIFQLKNGEEERRVAVTNLLTEGGGFSVDYSPKEMFISFNFDRTDNNFINLNFVPRGVEVQTLAQEKSTHDRETLGAMDNLCQKIGKQEDKNDSTLACLPGGDQVCSIEFFSKNNGSIIFSKKDNKVKFEYQTASAHHTDKRVLKPTTMLKTKDRVLDFGKELQDHKKSIQPPKDKSRNKDKSKNKDQDCVIS